MEELQVDSESAADAQVQEEEDYVEIKVPKAFRWGVYGFFSFVYPQTLFSPGLVTLRGYEGTTLPSPSAFRHR
jgi:hypothetical protein